MAPLVSGWMGQNNFTKWPVALYGFVLLMCSIAYDIISKLLVAPAEKTVRLAKAIGKASNGLLSLVLYCIGI